LDSLEPFCGARPRGGRAEQRFQTTKFLLAVIFYTLLEPFLNETADSSRRRSPASKKIFFTFFDLRATNFFS
jgi:hypothetical protein